MVQSPNEYDLSNITVLLVGPASIARIGPVLAGRGIKRFHSKDAAAALDSLYRCQPDAIICDQPMDKVDGIEFARIVRHAPNVPDPTVPIMLFLSAADRTTVKAARDAGIGQIVTDRADDATIWDKLRQAVINPPRFVCGEVYFGPDRRRLKAPAEPDRRKTAPTYVMRPCRPGQAYAG